MRDRKAAALRNRLLRGMERPVGAWAPEPRNRGCNRAYGYMAPFGAIDKMVLSSGETGTGSYDELMVTPGALVAQGLKPFPYLDPGL